MLLIDYLLAGVPTGRHGEGCGLNITLQSVMYHAVALPVVKARWAIIGQLCCACSSSYTDSKVSKLQ